MCAGLTTTITLVKRSPSDGGEAARSRLGVGVPAMCRRCKHFISVSAASIRGGEIPLPLPFPSFKILG